jgi:hypothetical protein
MESSFHNSAPLLAFIVRDRALNVFEPDKGLRVAEQTPAITLFPVLLALAKILQTQNKKYRIGTHQQTKKVGSCLCPPENRP